MSRYMKKIILGALLFLDIAASAHANLGDTESDIYAKYGKVVAAPTSVTNKDITLYFHYKDYTVSATLINGQCHRETFTKKDNHPFTDKEIQGFLDANALGSKWVMMNDNDSVKIWVLDSKAAFAGYYKEHPYLSLETHGMIEFNDAVKLMKETRRQPR